MKKRPDSPHATGLRPLLAFKRAQVPWPILLRNTAAVVLPLAWGIGSGRMLLGIAVSIGALVTMYSDQPGPYRERLTQLLAVAAGGGLATFLGLTLNHHLPALLLAALVVGFFGALLVTFGDAIARVGMTAMILLVVATALPAPTLASAVHLTVAVTAGGLLLTLFSIAAWPLQRHGPERAALASVYRELAAMARRTGAEASDALELTEGMTQLQHTVLGPHRARGAVMDYFSVMLELAERIRLELIALGTQGAGAPPCPLVPQEAATVLDAIATVILTANDAQQSMHAALQALLDAERRYGGQQPTPASAAWRHVQALSGQLAAAVRNASRAAAYGAQRAVREDGQLPRALRPQSSLALLAASLTPGSASFRHAIRTAVCFAAALWLSRLLPLQHGYWMPMTVAIVLRADYAATLSYGLLRMAGTVLGLLLTTALVLVLPASAWVHLAVLAVLCAGFRYLGDVNYGAAVACLTGTVVLLLAFVGERPEPTVIARLVDTVLGCTLALTVYALWPTWEKVRARPMLAQLLQAYAAYLLSITTGDAPQRQEMRQAARVARINAEASVQRLFAEPATPAALAELAQSLLTNGNRLARVLMTLEALIEQHGRLGDDAAARSLLLQAADALQDTATALRAGRAPEQLPSIRALQRHLAGALERGHPGTAAELGELCDRLVDTIDTLAHIIARATALSARAA